jgi:hypothetical protein
MRASALTWLAFLAFPAAAQWSGWDYDRDQPKEQFREAEVKLPEYPKDGELLRFEASAASPHRFFIDANSLSIGADSIVRYTLVVKTAGGATNVSYEGMRCDLRQLKIYASGGSKGTWMRARDPQWRRIETREVNRHHGVLFKDYFCAGKTSKVPVTRVKEALQLLRYGPPKSQGE